jgi:hypothetical protein
MAAKINPAQSTTAAQETHSFSCGGRSNMAAQVVFPLLPAQA